MTPGGSRCLELMRREIGGGADGNAQADGPEDEGWSGDLVDAVAERQAGRGSRVLTTI